MNKAKNRRLIWITLTLVIAIIYILLNQDIVDVLEDTSINTQLNEITHKPIVAEAVELVKKPKIGMFLETSKDMVIHELGQPSKKETDYLNHWFYNESIVYFDLEDKVIGYKDLGDLTDSLAAYFNNLDTENKSEDTTFFIGSSKTLIKQLMKAPTYIDPLQPDTWKYKNSTIHFNMKDVVDGYLNYYGEINRYLMTESEPNKVFTLGSTKDEVLAIMGSPSSVEEYHPNIWIYKLAKVYFDEDGQVFKVDDGYNDLKFQK